LKNIETSDLKDFQMPEIQNILIIANSARMLTQLAANIGFIPLVIDCYSDFDTQKQALDFVKVDSLALVHVKKALTILKTQHTITHVIYGSGLERYMNTLAFLYERLCVIGNTLDVFSSIQNKNNFFSRLRQLQIPYPDVAFQAPADNDAWLIKPMQGEGGIGIKKYKDQQINVASYYWQKQCAGVPMSVLFVANGTEFIIYGFNKQFLIQIGDNEFVFSGVISQPEINDYIVQTVSSWLACLVSEFALKGFNSLDFIAEEKQCYALEVNARPSASMQLYNEDLLATHINSFLDGNDPLLPEQKAWEEGVNSYRAYKILFAETEVFIKQNIEWPVWVVDIPIARSFIHTGKPICSIIADGKNEQQVFENLKLRQQQLSKLLR
jgi:methenyltetrahydromethanopterin cyclohydrolase